MHLSFKRFLVVSVITALMIPVMGTPSAEAARHKKHVHHVVQDRFAEIVIEASSGYVLSEKNADKKLYPASLSKLMTLYLTFDALEQGTLTKNQRVPVSKRAAAQEPSSLGLQPGETIRVEDAVLAIATKSANDCAVVLAEAVGGSEDRFARLMTAKAHQLGMNNTHFVNASGLFKPQQISSARDMAILARAIIQDHSRYYSYFSTESFTYAGNTYLNHNKLMASYPGMDGLKTGYVYASGYNLAASAVRNGTRLIGVIFGGNTAKSRNNAMAQLLNHGFSDVNAARVSSIPLKTTHKLITAEKAEGVPADSEVASYDPPAETAGKVVDQGDTSISEDNGSSKNVISEFKPRSLNTTTLLDASQQTAAATTASTGAGNWAIQIGAYASHDAGTQALQFAKASLHGMVRGIESIAPLMTSRGMIYRARLSGLARNDAAQACQILKGSCLVLTAD